MTEAKREYGVVGLGRMGAKNALPTTFPLMLMSTS